MGYATPQKRIYNKDTGIIEEWLNVDVQRDSPFVQGQGPDWLFDYTSVFDSFHLSEESDNDLAMHMLQDELDSSTSTSNSVGTSNIPSSSNSNSQEDSGICHLMMMILLIPSQVS